MLFSSISFIYYFLPIVLTIYFLVPPKLKNTILLVASLFFYFYGEPAYSVLMILSIISGYLHGLWIFKVKGSRYAKIPLLSSIIVSVGLLMFFKYLDFIIENINWVINLLSIKSRSLSLFFIKSEGLFLLKGLPFLSAKSGELSPLNFLSTLNLAKSEGTSSVNLPPLNLPLPLGISFYTFQILSYTIDVYRGDAKVQKNIFNFAAYVSLFPQLIAGPIVRYTTVEEELSQRTHSLADSAYGINRFIIGLSKKVLVANTLGELGKIFANTNEKTVLFYWISTVAFMFQIYYDFSGYSDMAIGLGRIFGFHFLENFNYPFISKSISEFWRRWHMSLGTWFRDYVYISMGGNRVSKWKWVRNIFVVWFLTGFWHGAQWNFIVWGLYFALLLVLEKLFLKRLLDKLPATLRHFYTLFFIVISFVLFNGNGLSECMHNLKGMFGLLNVPFSSIETNYYLRSYAFVFLIAIFGATPAAAEFIRIVKSYEEETETETGNKAPVVESQTEECLEKSLDNKSKVQSEKNIQTKEVDLLGKAKNEIANKLAITENAYKLKKGARILNRILNILEPVVHIILLLLITGYLVDGSFNPFLYFRF